MAGQLLRCHPFFLRRSPRIIGQRFLARRGTGFHAGECLLKVIASFDKITEIIEIHPAKIAQGIFQFPLRHLLRQGTSDCEGCKIVFFRRIEGGHVRLRAGSSFERGGDLRVLEVDVPLRRSRL